MTPNILDIVLLTPNCYIPIKYLSNSYLFIGFIDSIYCLANESLIVLRNTRLILCFIQRYKILLRK